MEAEDADVVWYHNGQRIHADDKRVMIVVDGKKRKLIIKDTLMADAGEISVRTNTDKSAANLKVACKSRSRNGNISFKLLKRNLLLVEHTSTGAWILGSWVQSLKMPGEIAILFQRTLFY